MGYVKRLDTPAGVRYEAVYRDPMGKERSKRFRLKKDAQEHVDQQRTDVRQEKWVDPAGGRTAFSEWVDEWKKTKVDLRPSSQRTVFSLVDLHIVPAFAELRLGQIKQPMVQAWVAMLAAEFRPNYTRAIYARLNQIFNAALTADLLKVSPCRDIILPKSEDEVMRFLNIEEVDRLGTTIGERWRALVLLGCWSGLRIGEIAALRRDRVDLLRGSVTVDATYYYDEDFVWRIGPPKTKASRRTVSLPRSVVGELDEHLRRYGDRDPGAYVFRGAEGGVLRPSQFHRDHWAPAVTAAGLDPLRKHDMRHTAISLWIASGMNVKEVQARWAHQGEHHLGPVRSPL